MHSRPHHAEHAQAVAASFDDRSAEWGRLGTLPSAEDVPSLAEMARWSSPQPAEPIMATLWSKGYSAAATVLNHLHSGLSRRFEVAPGTFRFWDLVDTIPQCRSPTRHILS